MNEFDLTLEGDICMDIGASTGGFTDCMLQNGATKVYSVDVGYGQFAWKLRQDPRVVCMEKTNIRYVTPEDIDDVLDFASVDVSFISLTKILEPARNLLRDGGQMVCLIKPQFEAGREKVGKKRRGQRQSSTSGSGRAHCILCAGTRIFRAAPFLFSDQRTGGKY